MSPFTKCGKGHDLTKPGAFLYDKSGNRTCRQCATEQKASAKKRATIGAFDG